MPIFNVDLQTAWYGVYLSNRYQVNCTTIAEAVDAGADIANIQRATIPPDAFIDAIRVSTPALADKVFNTWRGSIPGTRSTGSQLMPVFNRFRIDMSVGYVRPLRKFLVGVTEGDQAGGLLTNACIVDLTEHYCTPLAALGVVCSPTGVIVAAAGPNPQVGMRQLRRGSKKKKTPIL